jgi:hypothetical protein
VLGRSHYQAAGQWGDEKAGSARPKQRVGEDFWARKGKKWEREIKEFHFLFQSQRPRKLKHGFDFQTQELEWWCARSRLRCRCAWCLLVYSHRPDFRERGKEIEHSNRHFFKGFFFPCSPDTRER